VNISVVENVGFFLLLHNGHLQFLLFLIAGGRNGWNGWLKQVFRFGRISSWAHVAT